MNNPFSIRFIPLLALVGIFPLATRANELPQLPEEVFPELRQILADAATQSPNMIASNLELMVADGELQQAKSGLYPSIGGSYQLSQALDQRDGVSGTLKTEKTYYNFRLIQPIFHWGERRNTAEIGEIQRQIADENFQEAYRLLAQQIRGSYLTLIGSKIAVNNAVFNEKLTAKALSLALIRLEKKVTTEGEIFQARIGADQAKLELEKTRWQLEVLKQDFKTLTGGVTLRDEQIPNEIPRLGSAKTIVEGLLAHFLAQDKPDTAEARNHRKQLLIDDLVYQNQRTRLRPKFNFVVGLSQDDQNYPNNIKQRYGLQSQYVGLQVTWNAFDGFATRGAIASALARLRLDQHNYKLLTERLANDAKKAAQETYLSERQLAISERLLGSAADFLTYTKANFERGQASEVNVNNAQAGYNTMLSSTNSNRYLYLMSVSEFISLIAEDPIVSQAWLN